MKIQWFVYCLILRILPRCWNGREGNAVGSLG
jgi:hypothetical protein